MNTDERGFFDPLTERVLAAVFEVSNTLGAGFLEKVYERALLKELSLGDMNATTQTSFAVTYKGDCVGEYFVDLLVWCPTNTPPNASIICKLLAGPRRMFSYLADTTLATLGDHRPACHNKT